MIAKGSLQGDARPPLNLSGRRYSPDAVSGLTIFLVLQLGIPSVLRMPALGGVGYPAALWALLLGGWWCWERVQRGVLTPWPFNPVRIAVFVFTLMVLVSYAVAMRRPLLGAESSQADLGILRTLVGSSLVVFATDGIISWDRFVVLMRRIVIGGGLLAALGLLQFATGRSWIDWISIPGFVSSSYTGPIERAGFTRPTATAIHPLEYAAALSMVLPIALAFYLWDSSRSFVARIWPVAAIAFALLLSGSRSAYVGLILGAVIVALRCDRRMRLRLAVGGVCMAVVIFVTVPGMIGTIRGMFLYIGDDPSALSRTQSYAIVEEFFLNSPMLGRGMSTFLITYRILDNQILLLLVEVGVLGLLSFLALAAAASLGPWTLMSSAPDPRTRELAPAVAASLIAGVSLMMFFDAFGFSIAYGMMYLMIGAGGAYWTLASSADDVSSREMRYG